MIQIPTNFAGHVLKIPHWQSWQSALRRQKPRVSEQPQDFGVTILKIRKPLGQPLEPIAAVESLIEHNHTGGLCPLMCFCSFKRVHLDKKTVSSR